MQTNLPCGLRASALAATLATTGCKHGFNGSVTRLPGHKAQVPNSGDNLGGTLPPGGAMTGGEQASTVPGTGANTQPGGGASGLGISPSMTLRRWRRRP